MEQTESERYQGQVVRYRLNKRSFGYGRNIAHGRHPSKFRSLRSYLADFPRFSATEVASCEGDISVGEVYLALKRVDSDNCPGLDGLHYELYLRLSHIFMAILTVVFRQIPSPTRSLGV